MDDSKARKSEQSLPVIRANREDINLLFGLFAGLQEMKKAQEQMKKRISVIPNGWRDLRMLCSVTEKLVRSLTLTFPPEKIVSIQRMLPHMTYRLHCGATASRMNDDEVIMLERDLDTLAIAAHEQCKLCIEQQCARCPLGKVLDGIYCKDREDGSWASIDIESEEMSSP